MYGRRQQLIAGFTGLAVAWVMVTIFHPLYFNQNLFLLVDRVYVATINAGVDPGIIRQPEVPGDSRAIVQAIGGPDRQMGILLATGLLIVNPLAGWAVLAGIAIRLLCLEVLRRTGRVPAHHLRRWRDRWRCAVGIWHACFQGEVDVADLSVLRSSSAAVGNGGASV